MKRLTLTCLALTALNMSGCAQVSSFGDKLWAQTKKITTASGKTLRSRAPLQDAVFLQGTQVGHKVQGLTPIDIELYHLVDEVSLAPYTQYVSIELYGAQGQLSDQGSLRDSKDILAGGYYSSALRKNSVEGYQQSRIYSQNARALKYDSIEGRYYYTDATGLTYWRNDEVRG